MNGGTEQPLPPTLRGLPMARIFLDVGNQPRVEDCFAVVPGIEPVIGIEISTPDLPTGPSGGALQGVQPVRKEAVSASFTGATGSGVNTKPLFPTIARTFPPFWCL
jgi:hypothetical protein